MASSLEREGFTKIIGIDEALGKFFKSLEAPHPKLDRVSLEQAVRRVIGKDVVSTIHIPPADRSVVDGYALLAEDVQSASNSNPVVLEVMGESRIGDACRTRITRGKAVAVSTGSTIPPGADSVVMIETTNPIHGQRIEVRAPATQGHNITRRGEDVSRGELVLKAGKRFRPQDIGILKATGVTTVRVVRKPRIAIMSTGNELVESLTKHAGKVVDVNRPVLSAMVRELGAEPVDLGIAKDQEENIIRKMRGGLRTCDALLVSAGSSVGKRDLVPGCINSLGKPGMLVHGVAMRPAMPSGLAVVNGKAVISLPGFPVSAIVAFRVFARPLIARMMGIDEEIEPVVKAILKKKVSGWPDCRTFVRVTVRRTTEGLVAEPLRSQRSSVLMSMVAANGIVTIPEKTASLEAGQQVDVSLIGEILS